VLDDLLAKQDAEARIEACRRALAEAEEDLEEARAAMWGASLEAALRSAELAVEIALRDGDEAGHRKATARAKHLAAVMGG